MLACRCGALLCVLNFGASPVALPARERVLSSEPGIGDTLGTDQAVWIEPLA